MRPCFYDNVQIGFRGPDPEVVSLLKNSAFAASFYRAHFFQGSGSLPDAHMPPVWSRLEDDEDEQHARRRLSVLRKVIAARRRDIPTLARKARRRVNASNSAGLEIASKDDAEC